LFREDINGEQNDTLGRKHGVRLVGRKILSLCQLGVKIHISVDPLVEKEEKL
jgi:hypothetical protein